MARIEQCIDANAATRSEAIRPLVELGLSGEMMVKHVFGADGK